MITVDATGHRCPMPVLKVMKALAGAEPGAQVTLLATDPAALRDVPNFCAEHGHGCDIETDDAPPYRFHVTKAR